MVRRSSIAKAADWRRIRHEGRSGRCDGLRVRVLDRSSPDLPGRLGIRVRVSGSARAVTRNRARRRLRAAWGSLEERAGLDAVVYADETAADKNFQRLRDDLACALERAARGPQ